MFWGINTMPNLYTWNSLYPYNFATNYGGSVQFNTIPMTYSPQEAFAMRNFGNPFFYCAQMMNNTYSAFNPYQNMQTVALQQYGFNQGLEIGNNIGLDSRFGYTSQNISSLKSQVEAALKSDKLTDNQKAKLEALKQEIEALEKRVSDLSMLRQRGATSEQVSEALNFINRDYKALNEKAVELANVIKEEIATGATETDETDETETAGGKSTTKSGKSHTSSDDAQSICRDINKAIYGIGTDYDKTEKGLKPSMERINGDNVMDVIDQWDKTYAKIGVYADDKNGFIESLMDDCEWGQKEEIATYLIDALEEYAHNAGIDADEEIANARYASSSNWLGYSSTKEICRAVNALIEKIRNAQKAE